MTDKMKLWNSIKRPPPDVLRPIKAGRLKGKTDISPQWRYRAMTEQLGPCGIGWKYEIKRLWNEPGSEGQIFAFAEVLLYIKDGDQWSEGVPGIGGSMLIAKESAGLHSSDEGYKMAVTDALSVAMKMLGMAADIYEGLWDGSRYTKNDPEPVKIITIEQAQAIAAGVKQAGVDKKKFLKLHNIEKFEELTEVGLRKAQAQVKRRIEENKKAANADN